MSRLDLFIYAVDCDTTDERILNSLCLEVPTYLCIDTNVDIVILLLLLLLFAFIMDASTIKVILHSKLKFLYLS